MAGRTAAAIAARMELRRFIDCAVIPALAKRFSSQRSAGPAQTPNARAISTASHHDGVDRDAAERQRQMGHRAPAAATKPSADEAVLCGSEPVSADWPGRSPLASANTSARSRRRHASRAAYQRGRGLGAE